MSPAETRFLEDKNSNDIANVIYAEDLDFDFKITESERNLEWAPSESDASSPMSSSVLEVLPDSFESCMRNPRNDSGIELENELTVIDSDDDHEDRKEDSTAEPDKKEKRQSTTEKELPEDPKAKYRKPQRPCMFCKKLQSRLKRHILTKHKEEPLVKPLLKMNVKDQDRQIDIMRKQGVRDYNIVLLKSDGKEFMRERRNFLSEQDTPIMCSGCKGFFLKLLKHDIRLIAQHLEQM